MLDASSFTPIANASSNVGAKMQCPKDWLVRVTATPSLGTTSKVFSHHSLISLSVLATLTSKEVDLPSLRSTLMDVSVGSRPKLNWCFSSAALTVSDVSPVVGSYDKSEADVHSSPLLAIAAHAAPCTTAGCVPETPAKRTRFSPLTSPACCKPKLPRSYALETRPRNMADDPVNWRRSTLRNNSCSTAGSASGVIPGNISSIPLGRPSSDKSCCTSLK
mmetsp:Transcript_43356/g.114154  ORF Transcript_43356/g.114154 Transcript_43356/m.114154 type:complete len:219 (-) Transcript_43356:890-1546(-)